MCNDESQNLKPIPFCRFEKCTCCTCAFKNATLLIYRQRYLCAILRWQLRPMGLFILIWSKSLANANILFEMKYYFSIDATAESGRLGRLINHSKTAANCHTKLTEINQRPYLMLMASRDISLGEELLYDYGDRNRDSIESHPWLKF